MAGSGVLDRIADLASDQWGLVTRRQAQDAGVSTTSLERHVAPGSTLERVAFGVYRVVAAPIPDHLALRAAWLQLAPAVPAWERTADQGLVSHRSAAALYGLGDLPADIHEFALAKRRQTRRPDVRLHLQKVDAADWNILRGLPVTKPSRIAVDLLRDHEDPEAVAQVVADAIRGGFAHPSPVATALAPLASRYEFRPGDGLSFLRWLLELAGMTDIDTVLATAVATPAGAERGTLERP